MATASLHPPQERLAAFALGDVDDDELEVISDHLAGCEDCCFALKRTAPTDPLVEQIQAVSKSESPRGPLAAASHSAVRSLLKLEHSLGRVAPMNGGTTSGGSVAAQSPVPSQIQQYRIIEEVGRGGMGVVYHALDVSLNRHVALKMVLAGQFASAEQLVRFRLEAEIAARVRHPNVVEVYEIGEFRGQPFVAFEWINGGSLARRLQGQPLKPREATALIETLANAVFAAHCQGVIHRDLKPSNVLLNGDIPKIADFGLARRIDDDDRLTVTGSVLGTPEYMSPEQASGKSRDIGPATDIYALGVMLFEALTGRPPFRGASSLETLHQVMSRDVPAPGVINLGCPRDLETIALKCLKKAPSQRYATSGELAADLRRFLNGEPIHARPVGKWERTWSWCRRYPVVAGLLAALLVTLLSGIAISTKFAFDAQEQAKLARDEATNARRSEQTALAATRAAESAERLARARAYDANVLLLQSAWEQHQIPRFLELLELQRPQLGTDDLRNFEWHYWRRQLDSGHTQYPAGVSVSAIAIHPNGRELAIADQDGGVRFVQFSDRNDTITTERLRVPGPVASTPSDGLHDVVFNPDGTQFATASVDGIVRVCDTERGQQVWLAKLPDQAMLVKFTPDGKTLIGACKDGTVRFWDANNGRESPHLSSDSPGDVSFDISPDGTRLACSTPTGDLRLVEFATRREILRQQAHHGWIRYIQFSPNGSRIATTGYDRTVRIWRVETGRELLPPQMHSQLVQRVAWSSDSRRLLTAGTDFTLRLFDADTGREQQVFQGHISRVTAVAFHPTDSNIIISAGSDATIRIWKADSNPNPIVCPNGFIRPTQFACRPDGTTSFVPGVGQTIREFDNATGRELRVLSSPVAIRSAVLTPSGRTLLTANVDNTVSLWDVDSGLRQQSFHGHSAMINSIAIHPDGTKFATASDDHTVRLCELPNGQLLHELRGHNDIVFGVTFDPTGRFIASSSFDHTIKLWDTTTGQELQTLTGHTHRVFAITFNSTGTQLASASEDNTVKLWKIEPATEKPISHAHEHKTLRGHGGPVRSVAFTRDGKRLATGGWDRSIILWDTLTGQEVSTLKSHDDEVMSLTFSSDNSKLFSLSNDGTFRIWNASSMASEGVLGGRK